MRRLVAVLALTLALLLVVAGVALAVTNGEPDGDRHPYVGLAVFDDADGPAWRCSVSLLSPTVVLTAGHCTDGAVAARVWFDSDVSTNPEYPFSGETSYDGTPYTFPGFCIECGNGLPGFATGDVGIIVLSEPVTENLGFAQLPEAGLVDTLAMNTPVDLVGYGVQYQNHGGGPPTWAGPRIRMYAPTQLKQANFVHSDEFLRLTANPGQGRGGTCFGDSGGPDLLGGTNVVLGVNSYVTNNNCAGVTYSMRIDLQPVLDWINSFLD